MRTHSIGGRLGRAVRSALVALFLTALAADAASVFQTHRVDLSRNRISTSAHRIRLVSKQVSPSKHTIKHEGMSRKTDYRVRHGYAKKPLPRLARGW